MYLNSGLRSSTNVETRLATSTMRRRTNTMTAHTLETTLKVMLSESHGTAMMESTEKSQVWRRLDEEQEEQANSIPPLKSLEISS